MLVGSCIPSTGTFRVVFISCIKPDCGYKASAMSEVTAIAELDEHFAYARQVEHVLPIEPFTGESDGR